jgi:PAS domain S-box-containing protein
MEIFKDAQFRVSAFFELTPDLVCVAGRDGYFKKVNPAVMRKLEYTEPELMARPIESFMHPDDRELTLNKREALLNGKELLNFQNRYLTKTGKVIWLEWTSIYFSEEELVFAIAKDVSEKKYIEKEVEEKYKKFRSLATHFKRSIEQDRKYLANELHEELAQLVAVLKMDIDWISSNLPELQAPLKSRIEHAQVMSELLITTIRRISFSISPNMLEDIGLHATLEWHAKEFSILNGIPCFFESNYNEADLTHEVKVDFFRICQEALTNVMYHAVAGSVRINIEDADDKIYLSIIDDGKGFDINQEKQTPGLTKMRERAASINGHLTIHSEPGKGTKVCVTVGKAKS